MQIEWSEEKIKQELIKILEKIYEVEMAELPTNRLEEICRYAEATRNGFSINNWKKYIFVRDKQGLTIADDKFIELLLKAEKVFEIEIKDEEAERVYALGELEELLIKKLIQ